MADTPTATPEALREVIETQALRQLALDAKAARDRAGSDPAKLAKVRELTSQATKLVETAAKNNSALTLEARRITDDIRAVESDVTARLAPAGRPAATPPQKPLAPSPLPAAAPRSRVVTGEESPPPPAVTAEASAEKVALGDVKTKIGTLNTRINEVQTASTSVETARSSVIRARQSIEAKTEDDPQLAGARRFLITQEKDFEQKVNAYDRAYAAAEQAYQTALDTSGLFASTYKKRSFTLPTLPAKATIAPLPSDVPQPKKKVEDPPVENVGISINEGKDVSRLVFDFKKPAIYEISGTTSAPTIIFSRAVDISVPTKLPSGVASIRPEVLNNRTIVTLQLSDPTLQIRRFTDGVIVMVDIVKSAILPAEKPAAPATPAAPAQPEAGGVNTEQQQLKDYNDRAQNNNKLVDDILALVNEHHEKTYAAIEAGAKKDPTLANQLQEMKAGMVGQYKYQWPAERLRDRTDDNAKLTTRIAALGAIKAGIETAVNKPATSPLSVPVTPAPAPAASAQPAESGDAARTTIEPIAKKLIAANIDFFKADGEFQQKAQNSNFKIVDLTLSATARGKYTLQTSDANIQPNFSLTRDEVMTIKSPPNWQAVILDLLKTK